MFIFKESGGHRDYRHSTQRSGGKDWSDFLSFAKCGLEFATPISAQYSMFGHATPPQSGMVFLTKAF